MAESTFSKEQVVALEKILGVKLPEQGFTLEITPVGGVPLDEAQLDKVTGGIVIHGTQALGSPVQIGLGQLRWSAKI